LGSMASEPQKPVGAESARRSLMQSPRKQIVSEHDDIAERAAVGLAKSIADPDYSLDRAILDSRPSGPPRRDDIRAKVREVYRRTVAENSNLGTKTGLGESNKPDYTVSRMGDTAIDLNAEAIKLGFTSESALETLRQASASARETTDRATAEPRPETAVPTATTTPAVAWPSEKWKNASEKIRGKKRGIVTFLQREWEPFIQKSGQVVTRDILAMHDPDAEQALTRHLETHDFPEGISIVYPKRLMKLASERPDHVRRALGTGRGIGMR
jgi:hypothetical protein